MVPLVIGDIINNSFLPSSFCGCLVTSPFLMLLASVGGEFSSAQLPVSEASAREAWVAGIPRRRLTYTSGHVFQVSEGLSLGKRIRRVAPEGRVGRGVRWEELDLGLVPGGAAVQPGASMAGRKRHLQGWGVSQTLRSAHLQPPPSTAQSRGGGLQRPRVGGGGDGWEVT